MPIRLTYFFGFLLIVLLLTISIYLQIFDNFIPCPLCTLQRITFVGLGIWFLTGMVFGHKRLAAICINSLAFVTALTGTLLAGRQVWLQHYAASSSGECGVSLQYMVQVLPLTEVMQKIFAGSAECTQIGWQFLSLDMAEWSLVWFIFFILMTLYLFKQIPLMAKNKKNKK